MMLMGLLLAFVCGHAIAWVYMFTHTGLSYSKSFVNSLVVIPTIVSMVMLVLSNNLVTAFGLMAIFAIVRFPQCPQGHAGHLVYPVGHRHRHGLRHVKVCDGHSRMHDDLPDYVLHSVDLVRYPASVRHHSQPSLGAPCPGN